MSQEEEEGEGDDCDIESIAWKYWCEQEKQKQEEKQKLTNPTKTCSNSSTSFYDYIFQLHHKVNSSLKRKSNHPSLNRLDLTVNGPTILRSWIQSQIKNSSNKTIVDKNLVTSSYSESLISDLHLLPVSFNSSTSVRSYYDSILTISIARSYGLKVSSGARGDATSYVYIDGIDAPVAVVKVLKDELVFSEELATYHFMKTLLPSPKYFRTPQIIAAICANIPQIHSTNRETSKDKSDEYGVNIPINQSNISLPHTRGGVILMSLARGMSLSSLLSPAHSLHNQLEFVINSTAKALAELHSLPSPLNKPNLNESPTFTLASYIQNSSDQMIDMINKLSNPIYSPTLIRHEITIHSLDSTRSLLFHGLLSHLPPSSFVHGDCHAGNIIWDDESKLITFIDIPTLLQSVTIKDEPDSFNNITVISIASRDKDLCHFKQKLVSQGMRAGMSIQEVKLLQNYFNDQYRLQIQACSPVISRFPSNDESVNDTKDWSELFFSYRCLMGEFTQLVKYAPEDINQFLTDRIKQVIQIALNE